MLFTKFFMIEILVTQILNMGHSIRAILDKIQYLHAAESIEQDVVLAIL